MKRTLRVLVVSWLVMILVISAVPSPAQLPAISADQPFQQGVQQYQTGQIDAAVRSWQQVRQQEQQNRNPQGEANALEKLGVAALTQARYRDAIAQFTALLPLLTDPPMTSRRAFALSNLGIAHKNLGNYSQAAKLQRQAGKLLWNLSQSATDRDRWQQALGQVLSNLGNAEEAQGNYEQAQQAYEQSWKLAVATGDRLGESIALNNLGGIASVLGQDELALEKLTQSLQLSRSQRDRDGEASTLLNLGAIYHFRNRANDRQTAIKYYQDSLTLAESLQNRPLAASALSSLGSIYADLKDYNRAIALHQKSVALAKAIGDPELQAKSLNNLGHTLFAAQRLPEAAASLRQAIAQLDGLRLGLTDRYKVSIFDTQLHSYNLLMQILVADRQPEAALVASEQGRARAFAELLAQRQRHPSTPQLPPITLDQIRQIARQQQATLVEYAIVPDDDFKFRGKQHGREAELFIWVVQPTGKIDLRRVDLKPLWQRQVTLKLLVAAARCLNPDCPSASELATERGVWQRSGPTKQLGTNKQLGTSKTKSLDRPVALTYPGLPELHHYLIQPIADLLPTNPQAPVVFIPQAALFLVPFAALPNPQGKYLIEQHTLLHAPSIQVLGLTQSQRPPAQTANHLVVGNPDPMPENLPPLPGSETEAIAVAKILNTTAITGKQATKTRIVKQFSTAQIIHLATHGLLEQGQSNSLDAPGAIAFAPDQPQESGLLTTEEIIRFNPRLKAELVVLSACDTGRGTITGDGVLGLSRSWIAAGVPSVVVSLWAVNDDSTATLMIDFYESRQKFHLNQANRDQVDINKTNAAALRHAMLTTMQQYPQPKHWAPFILIGQ
jgi:CHAT domain-containing protein